MVGLAGQSEEFPEISKFCGTSQVLVCGSTHREDEQMLAATIQSLPDRDQWKILIAPHEIHEQAISRLINDLPLDSVRYSELPNKPSAHILIIDCIGLLSRLYKYGRVAYIGGGFGKGIHNTLEPFSFGLPVIIGPRFRAFDEAVAMVDAGGARVVITASDIQEVLKDWSDNDTLEKASQAVLSFIEANRGAARHTMNQISQLLS